METKILILDIETAPIYTWQDLPQHLKDVWEKKVSKRFNEIESVGEKYNRNASFFTLFSKVICLCVSFSDKPDVKSYIGDEKDILNNFAKDLALIGKKYLIKFAGHNILSFDLPFIMQRALINKITMPIINRIIGCKPWEVPAYDTMIMWQMSSKEWTSLDYICECLGIESPKGEMEGSLVAEEFFNGNIEKIKAYCEKDVIATKSVFNILFNNLNS